MSDENIVWSTGPDDEPKPETCHNCGDSMVHYYPDGRWEYDNVLRLSMEGGYGQFTDLMVENMEIQAEVTGAPRGEIFLDRHAPTDAQKVEILRRRWALMEIMLCHKCSHKLCDLFPAFANKIQPHSSHSHKMTYVEAHPDHYGWDYDMRKEREENL